MTFSDRRLNMKLYALFLPQFYETKENNKWWGKGFTEWTNVKKAEPLYNNQIQPIHPLDGKYYNMLDKDTVIWQTELMHKYGIDAFVYYHYYFKGYKLLEKPAENLLRWKDINQSFFFNWANHSWKRSWKGSQEVLVEQTYGNKTDWRVHFDYLSPFFRDKRYVKINNMPVLIIYSGKFKEKEEMFSCFDLWCKEIGFDGLYLIEECARIESGVLEEFNKNLCSVTKDVYYTMPSIGMGLLTSNSVFRKNIHRIVTKLVNMGVFNKVRRYQGDKVLSSAMSDIIKNGIPGLFFSWDNTPRHDVRGYVIDEISFQAFEQYMEYYRDCDFMIINAWNEWCEGMVLEPTDEHGYKYLEWLRDFKSKNEPIN